MINKGNVEYITANPVESGTYNFDATRYRFIALFLFLGTTFASGYGGSVLLPSAKFIANGSTSISQYFYFASQSRNGVFKITFTYNSSTKKVTITKYEDGGGGWGYGII